MKRLLLSFVAIVMVIMTESFTFAESYNIPEANAFILMDIKTGQVLVEKNSLKLLPPASTTKVMTAILAIEFGDLEKKCIASFNAVHDIGKDGMNIGLVPGEELRLEDLLNALLVRSANETANIIAENLAPSKEDFVRLMNQRAKELGAMHTTFLNPCGKDTDTEDEGLLSTAKDLAILSRHAMTLPKFREIVEKKIAKIPPTNKKNNEQFLGTTNKLLGTGYKSNIYSKITGIKTGYTEKAGNNLIASAVNADGNELIAVVMGHRNGNIFQSMKGLLEYGFLKFQWHKVVEKGSLIKTIPAPEDATQTIQLVAGEEFSVLLPVNSNPDTMIEKKESLNPSIAAPINLGDVLGFIEYSVNQTPIAKIPLFSGTQLQSKVLPTTVQPSSIAKVLYILGLLLSFVFILLAAFLLLRRQSKYFKQKRWIPFSKNPLRFFRLPALKFKLPVIRRKKKSSSPETKLKNVKYFKHYHDKWG